MIKISDAHWDRIRHHFPEEGIPDDRPGRKPVPARRVLDAVLWILTTGAQWHLLPQSYPNYKTVHRRFQAWARQDILRGILVDLANELRERDLLDTTECYIDATFANGRGGGLEIGNTKCGKGVKIMAIVAEASLRELESGKQQHAERDLAWQQPRERANVQEQLHGPGPLAFG